MQHLRATLAALACLAVLHGEQRPDEAKQRVRAVKDLAKAGSGSIPQLAEYLRDADLGVRVEATRSIAEIGTQRALEPLIAATRDNDPEVQIRAIDGLVDFYLPGYMKSGGGMSASLKRVGNAIKAKFVDSPDQVIGPYVTVRPDVIEAIRPLVTGGASVEARADAARALGVLRGRAGLDDLIAGVKSKEDDVIYQSLMAVQKIGDPAAAPRVAFRLRDLDEKVQIAAIETVGQLQNRESSPELRDVVERARNARIKRAALEALSKLPDETNRTVYWRHLADKDDGMRAAAAEGIGRLQNQSDQKTLENAFEHESKMNPRLSMAFAAVKLGRNELSEFSPLQYLVNTLNSKAWKGIAQPFLAEVARDPGVRRTLYGALKGSTKDEKIGLAQVFAQSGDADSVPYVETLAKDPDADVAQEGLRALKTLKARL